LLVQVDACDIETELGSQHVEEAEHVVGRLREDGGCGADAFAAQLRQSLHTVDVAVGDREAVAPAPARRNPLHEAAFVRLPQDVARPSVAGTELGADQGAAGEAELAQVALDRSQVLVVELAAERREEARETFGAKLRRVLVDQLAQSLEHVDEQLERAH
jgi:hypothetical protein